MTSASEPLSLFAVTPPGLEALAAAELAALGIRGAAEPGGVAWDGPARELYAASLHLRTATRILARIAGFRARTFFELERHARRVEWARWLDPDAPVRLRVSSSKSRLYHERAIGQRILDAVRRELGEGVTEAGGEDDEDDAGHEQLLVVRFHRDQCTLSVDSSGDALHRRGYRQAVAKAPMRETLAAAMLRACGWDGQSPLLDPLCGSGTIPIEAALLARRIPPALASPDRTPRPFAFQRWPGFDPIAWEQLVDAARAGVLPRAGAPIQGSDRDAGAIAAATANADRAGVAPDLHLAVHSLSAVDPPDGVGWVVVNPPYGIRVGESGALRDLYAALGRWARSRAPGWRLALLGADPRLERHIGLPLHEAFRTRNGGIPVRLLLSDPI